MKLYAIMLSMAFVLSACAAVGPNYTPPAMSVPDTWTKRPEISETNTTTDLSRWWITLKDERLIDLISRSLQGNPGVREAVARIREARARRGISESRFFPQVNASANLQHSRNSSNAGLGGERDLYMAGLDAGWELDIFGGTRRAVEAAQANLEATHENLRNVYVTLAAEVALSYLDLRSQQNRLAIAEQNLAVQQETLNLVKSRFDAGLVTELDVNQAVYNLKNTQAQIFLLKNGITQAQHSIAVLLGLPPAALKAELDAPGPVPVASLTLAMGVPADVLRNRPDVRMAERQLAAQTAQIGVATAALYPKFTLTGSIGLEAFKLDRLFQYDSRTFGIGPGVQWNVFDAGSIRRNIEVQNALQEQALVQYETSVLNALKEVEDALSAFAEEYQRLNALREGEQAAENAVNIATAQYKAGIVDFQAVLETQRSLLSLQDQATQSEANVTGNLVRLYKALGGGWQIEVKNDTGAQGHS